MNNYIISTILVILLLIGCLILSGYTFWMLFWPHSTCPKGTCSSCLSPREVSGLCIDGKFVASEVPDTLTKHEDGGAGWTEKIRVENPDGTYQYKYKNHKDTGILQGCPSGRGSIIEE